jgi:hypothetical protein
MRTARHPNVSLVACLLILVCILLLNDFLLKDLFHNFLTGKLSDFVGLAALALFVYLLAPHVALPSVVLIGATFVWWKSPLSSGFIDFANSFLPFSIGRVVDPTDLAALIVLPIVVVLAQPERAWAPKRAWEWGVAGLSIFAFAATADTIPTDFRFRAEYSFTIPADSLVARIRRLNGPTILRRDNAPGFGIEIPWRCSSGLYAETRVSPRADGSILLLEQLWSYCDPAGAHSSQLLLLFEDSVVTRLQES